MPELTPDDRERLEKTGCEVFVCRGDTHSARLVELLGELGRRRLTNVLVEGGGGLVGSLLDSGEIDEVHVFLAPKLVGGASATSPIGGEGIEEMSRALALKEPEVRQVGSDVYVQGRVAGR